MSSVVLQELKEQLRTLGGFHEREFPHSSDSATVSLPVGAITQVIGAGKTERLVEVLAKNFRETKTAWIEAELSIYPNALLQRKLNLQNILFAEAGHEYVWTTLQILGSSLFQTVVLSLFDHDLKALQDLRTVRRLQLATEKAKCSLILLVDTELSAWPIRNRL